jgi:uncharacterized protein (DUF58 family)
VNPRALREALLRGRRRPRRSGAGSPTSYRGDGYEFVELRGYVDGDDVRRIDWAASARSGTLQSRVVLEDVALTLAIVLDDSESMRVGRERSLLDAARDAYALWLAAAQPGDRLVRVDANDIVDPRVDRTAPFSLQAALTTARAGLRRGTALLVISDWYDTDALAPDALRELGRWCDCTALIARDPWHEGLPLGGFVQIRGAEGGALRAYIGSREREHFVRAVRERETHLLETFERAGWRSGFLEERDGAVSLAAAFGAHG